MFGIEHPHNTNKDNMNIVSDSIFRQSMYIYIGLDPGIRLSIYSIWYLVSLNNLLRCIKLNLEILLSV